MKMITDKSFWTTTLVVVLPTLVAIFATAVSVAWLGMYSENTYQIPGDVLCTLDPIPDYIRHLYHYNSTLGTTVNYANVTVTTVSHEKKKNHLCTEREYLHSNYYECVCGNLNGVRPWRLAAMAGVLGLSAYATRSLNKTKKSKRDRKTSELEPGRALSDAIAEYLKETGLSGHVVTQNRSGQKTQDVWDRLTEAESDPYQRMFYEWALKRQPDGVALGPRLNMKADTRYPSISHELTGRSLKRTCCVYVGNSLDSSECWVFANGEIGTLAGHQGLFLTNVGMVKFTRLQYRSNVIGLTEGSWVVINNQAVEEDISDACVALTGWTNTLFSLVGFVAGGSSAWSASLGINAATEVVAGLIYTIARGNGPRHERVRGFVDPMMSSFVGPALLGGWAWAILSLESLGAILSLFALAVGGNGAAAALALLVGLTGSVGTIPSMSGKVALVGSMLSWYSTEFVIETYGLISSSENWAVKLAFATGAVESCILLAAYYKLLSCANAISKSTGVEAVVKLGNLGITSIPAVGLVPRLQGGCKLLGLRSSVHWPRGRVRSLRGRDLTVEGLSTGAEIELHDPDVPESGYEAYVLGPSLPRDTCSTKGWRIPLGWGGYGCYVVGDNLVPILSKRKEKM